MNRKRNTILFFGFLLVAVLFSACSGPIRTGGGGGGGGAATVSFTVVADTLPANPSLLSFKLSVTSITLTPTTGTAQTLTPATPVIDLMRLQSDTAFLGSLPNVPAGTYTVQVSLSSPTSGSTITFLNDTTSSITAGSTTCASGSVCSAALSVTGNPTIGSFTFTALSSGKQGIELDFNLKNAVSLSGSVLTVNLNPPAPNPGVLSAFTLPRLNANLSANQLELTEDFTGVVSLSGSNVTFTSPARGTLTAVNTASSFFDVSPDGKICPAPATITCAVNGQIASVDAFLNSDGTISLKEFEPLTSTQQDLVEGTVYTVTPGSSTQFGIVVTEKTQAASGSLIGSLNTGDLLTVNIPSPQPFLVDTKGLPVSSVAPSTFQNFAGQTSTSAIHQGQSVTVHITAFTAASGPTIASATADTVTLRWSRFASAVQTASSPTFTIVGLPSYFGFSQGSFFGVQTFMGTPGADGVTNFDGVADGSGLTPSTPPVALRALFLENTANSANPAFFAAKVRQH